jgi:hypothetical protein
MNIKNTLVELFPLILQPEWVFCDITDVPESIRASFYEEEEYLRRIGKNKMDIKIKGYRYILTPKKEVFMSRRKVSLL